MSGTTSLDAARVAGLLARGGLDPARPAGGAGYNALADPAATDLLGRALAAAVRDLRPSVVLVWERPEDAVLAHVVARELGLGAVRAFDADGLVGHGPGLEPGARIVLVGDVVRDPQAVNAARGLAAQLRGELVATAVLLGTPELDALEPDAGRVVALTRAEEERP